MAPMSDPLALPLAFRPAYINVVWGGRRLEAWRTDLPSGPIGESWELSDQARGVSVIAEGPLAGRSLPELVGEFGSSLVGSGFTGDRFPLLIKLIDAQDRLSVQVHPDDDLARELGVGSVGKTECWLMAASGGEIYQGTRPGVDRETFEAALSSNDPETVAATLNRFAPRDGDFFFLPARTVHAIGAGSLLCEVQQSADITFRVFDWGRVGLDGKPRETHVAESLATIDFSARDHGPVPAVPTDHPQGGSVRRLVSCPYFTVEERRAVTTAGARPGVCSVLVNLGGSGLLATSAGSVPFPPMTTRLVAASAGPWSLRADDQSAPMRVVVAHPVFQT